jgi:hypothetical protein
VVVIALFMSSWANHDCAAQQETAQAKPLTLENYAPFFQETYPTVRAVVVSRGDC